MTKDADECAREVLEVVPSVMRSIRGEMRRHRALGLSVPQFRSLLFIARTGGTSLGAVAENLGLTPPSACKLIDGLSARGMVVRGESPRDRRRVILKITTEGARSLARARREAQRSLSRALGSLDGGELSAVIQGMSALKRVFVANEGAPSGRRSRTDGNS